MLQYRARIQDSPTSPRWGCRGTLADNAWVSDLVNSIYDHARGTQLACHEVRAFQRAGTHGHVGALLQDISDLIGQHDIQRHVRVECQELGGQRQQEVMPKERARWR